MSGPLLKAAGLGKCFRQFAHERDRILGWFGLSNREPISHWAVRDVSFTLNAGEAIGIIGANGAGKSTLLKMLTGTLRPSEGTMAIQGRVGAILELGLGFNPDLTGRDNAYHVSGLMGVPLGDIERALPGIEAFAEVGRHFDQPMRLSSSGMQMRVAFAIVTAFRPDILIVDEALSVGDAYFQHKSADRIRAFRDAGTALVFVSHDRSAVLSVCDRALLLESGRVIADGEPHAVLDLYNAKLGPADHTVVVETQPDGAPRTRSGSGDVVIQEVSLHAEDGAVLETVACGAPVILRIHCHVANAVPRLVIGYAIKNRLGQVMYGTNTYYSNQIVSSPEPGTSVLFEAHFRMLLGPGSYSISVALVGDAHHIEHNYAWEDLALVFEVMDLGSVRFDGMLYMPPELKVSQAPWPGAIRGPAS